MYGCRREYFPGVIVVVDFEALGEVDAIALGYDISVSITGKGCLVHRLVGGSLCSVGLFRSKEVLKIFLSELLVLHYLT